MGNGCNAKSIKHNDQKENIKKVLEDESEPYLWTGKNFKKLQLKILGQIRWLWKANADPFTNQAAVWSPYDLNDSLKLESAFQKKFEIFEIGDYYIDFKRMLQMKKDDTTKQRPVMREDPNNLPKIFRINRFGETMKFQIENNINDINQISIFCLSKLFRNIFIEDEEDSQMSDFYYSLLMVHLNFQKWLTKHYISYLSNNQKLKNDLKKLNHEVVKWILIYDFSKDPFLQDYIKKYILQINKDNVFSQVIKMYTEDGKLYRALNAMLRSSTEFELKNNLHLIFFLLLLMHALKMGSEEEHKKKFEKICLYRSINLGNEEAFVKFINDYKEGQFLIMKQFLSTSKSNNIFENAFFCGNEGITVLFEITSQTTDLAYYTFKSCDISKNSLFSTEEEVLFNPFNIFKVDEVGKLKEENGKMICKIKLSVFNNVYSALDDINKDNFCSKYSKLIGKQYGGKNDWEKIVEYSINIDSEEFRFLLKNSYKMRNVQFLKIGFMDSLNVAEFAKILAGFKKLRKLELDFHKLSKDLPLPILEAVEKLENFEEIKFTDYKKVGNGDKFQHTDYEEIFSEQTLEKLKGLRLRWKQKKERRMMKAGIDEVDQYIISFSKMSICFFNIDLKSLTKRLLLCAGILK